MGTQTRGNQTWRIIAFHMKMLSYFVAKFHVKTNYRR